MIRMFQSVIDRVKAMFTLDAMLDLEQQFASRQAERRAQLAREANQYQQEGLTAIAADLRRRAEELSEERPLQVVAPFLGRLTVGENEPAESASKLGGRNRRSTKPPHAISSDSRTRQR